MPKRCECGSSEDLEQCEDGKTRCVLCFADCAERVADKANKSSADVMFDTAIHLLRMRK